MPLTVIVLTFNESTHIARCLNNVVGWAKAVFVLDSHSTDDTAALAEHLGAKVFYRNFDNYAAQRNHAIQALPIETEWVLFLDADEYLEEALKKEISNLLEQPTVPCDGYYLKRKFYFMGRWIRYGGYYPTWLLRLFKRGHARCEREVNEHIQVEGSIGYLQGDFVDHNLKGFGEWLNKHNKYASMEAEQLSGPFLHAGKLWGGTQAERKQWIRTRIWNRLLPPLVRPFLYFCYRYFARLGFLDGKVGFIYHFFHGLVYPLMIDVKYLETRMKKRKT